MQISLLSRKIVRELCMNSRVTITELSRKLGVPRATISKHIESLEKELGLRYTLDINYNALGFTKMNIYLIKFVEKPPKEAIEKILARSKNIELALWTKGDFDMVLFVLAGNEEEYAKWHLSLWLEFSKYGVSVSKSDLDILHHGFVPLNRSTLEQSDIEEIYKKMLVELNDDSRITIKDLAKRLGMHDELVSYYMVKLEKMNIINRFTAIITKPVQMSNVLFFMTYTYREGHVERIYEKRRQVYFKKEDEPPLFNEYPMVTSMSGAVDDYVWGTAENDTDAIENRVKLHERIFKRDKPVIRYGIVESVLQGYMPIRSVDIHAGYKHTDWGGRNTS